jgi:hypothetical protein
MMSDTCAMKKNTAWWENVLTRTRRGETRETRKAF